MATHVRTSTAHWPEGSEGIDLTDYQLRDEKGIPGGYPSLDEITGRVPISQLPASIDAGADAVVMSSSGLERDLQVPQFTRWPDNPVFTGDNVPTGELYWPAMLRVDEILDDPIDTWYMWYSTNHAAGAGGISLATAPHPTGPWTYRSLVYVDSSSGHQTETPSVIYNETENLFFMYYQQSGVSGGGITGESQATCLATSANGTTWNRVGPVLLFPAASSDEVYNGGARHTGYFKPQRIGGYWFGQSLTSAGDHGLGGMWHSRDGRKWMLDGLLPGNDSHLTADNNIQMAHVTDILRWRGTYWALTKTGAYVSGTGFSTSPPYMAAMSSDLRTFTGGLIPARTDPTPIPAWEGTGDPGLGWLTQDGGTIWAVYTNGPGTMVGVASCEA